MLKITERWAKLFAIIWLLFISVLFFLPGSAFPKENWLTTVYFDKWVHFGFFAILIFAWRFYLPASAKYYWYTLLGAFLYGFGVEVVQHHFVSNRSFDLGDLIADIAGAFAGIWFWQWYIKK